ncbi:hypothetical protein HIC20_01885 [Buchnera aphidicola (Hormaphis cornu)]|nr:hypothetical protein HIC20_01885 [Buchnera aphidicola (Hormaphis cornu)]
MINFFKIIVKLLKWNIKLLSFLREFCTNVILVTLIIIIMKIWLQYKQTTKISLNSYKALNINIKGFIVDTFKSHNSHNFINYLTSFENNQYRNISVFDIVEKIRTAKKDKYITGIILNLTELQDSELNLLDYIGKSIKEFRNSGKKVYAIGNNYSQIQYYLSSFADKIFYISLWKSRTTWIFKPRIFLQTIIKKT